LSQIVLLDVALLRLRRPIRDKPSGYLRFAALATKPGEKCGLTPRHSFIHPQEAENLGSFMSAHCRFSEWFTVLLLTTLLCHLIQNHRKKCGRWS